MRSGYGAGVGLAILLLWLVFTRDAHAYLDLGTGSYVFQMLLASLVGGLFVLKMSWKRVKVFVRRLFRRKDTDGNARP